MSGWERRPPAYRASADITAADDLQEIRPGRQLSVDHLAGSDTTIVFVHGAGGNKRQFAALWAHFAERGCTLLAWDAFGHGASQPFDRNHPETLAPDALLDDFEILLNRHRAGITLLVGHSFGARLVLALLLRLAARERLPQIDGAVLLAPAPPGAQPAVAPARTALAPFAARLPAALLELTRPLAARTFRRRAWHRATDPALIRAQAAETAGNTLAMIRALRARSPLIATADLAALRLPISILAGEADRLTPPAGARALAAALPDATFEILPGAAHQLMLERPDLCIAAIEKLHDIVRAD